MLTRRSTKGLVLAIIAAVGFCAAAEARGKAPDRAPRFADYPAAKLSHMRVAKPKIPKSWDEDPRLRFQDSVGESNTANFAGHYFVATWGCGTTCVWGGIVEAKSGRIIELPSVSGWFDTHEKFEVIDFRHHSRLVVLSGARAEDKRDMGRHFYVLENGKLRFLKTIKSGRNFMRPNE